VPETKRRLTCVHSGAKELELERGLELAERRWRRRSHAEAALPHSGERAVIAPELILEGRQLGHTQRVGPVRVDLLEVVADVEHRETVNLEAWPRRRLLCL
jgi:hypothetical protein